MNLIHPIVYLSLISFIIFLIYKIVYKNYRPVIHTITTPEQALQELLQGNKKYNSFWNFITKAHRKSVTNIQRPFAIILSCSDSRVPTEIIFNQMGLGNLFIIRNAGNIAEGVVLGSIEYGIDQLKALLIIVLGHERCGAVSTTIDCIIENKPEPSGNINKIINSLKPAAQTILEKHSINQPMTDKIKTKIINETVKENVLLTIKKLYNNSDIIAKALDNNNIKIVGAYYDLDEGDVQIIS